MRTLNTGIAAIIFAAAGLAAGGAHAAAQQGYDRPGGDYASVPIANGDPAVCAARCEHDKNCRSWSFSYPPESGGPARCWLKRDVMRRVPSSCCVSGVRGAGVVEPPHGEVEYAIDRVGGDYRSFDTAPDPQGRSCAAACQADARCRAWTYRRPGYDDGLGPRCFLKERITTPRRAPCCMSGVVR